MKRIRFLHKTSLATIIGVTLLVATVMPVRADDLQQQLNQSKQQADQVNGALNVQKDKVAGATTQVMSLKQSVSVLNNSIAREQIALTNEQNNLKGLEDQQKKLEDQHQEHIIALGNVLKSNYEDGVTAYVAMLFQATSVSDFIERADRIQMIVGTYGKLQKDIVALNATMDNQKELIKQNQITIQASIKGKAQTQQDVQQALDAQQIVLNQLSSDERLMLSSSLSAKAKVSRVEQLIQQEAIEAADQKSFGPISRGGPGVSGPVAVSGGAGQILSFAAQFLGTPYHYGGQNPGGFDCSGFTSYVFKNAGISLSRTSQDQIHNGVYVDRSALRPGDLVFFHTSGGNTVSHVGIYVGNNTMINSANGGVSYDNISDSYWGPRWAGASRVIAP